MNFGKRLSQLNYLCLLVNPALDAINQVVSFLVITSVCHCTSLSAALKSTAEKEV